MDTITIANLRAEKAARKLAKKLGLTITEAVATACERLLDEQDAATRGNRRGEAIARMHAEIRQRGLLKARPKNARDWPITGISTTSTACLDESGRR